jgi:hypothetical protein
MAYGHVNISGGKDIERIQNLSITYRCECATPNERRFIENITVYIDFPTHRLVRLLGTAPPTPEISRLGTWKSFSPSPTSTSLSVKNVKIHTIRGPSPLPAISNHSSVAFCLWEEIRQIKGLSVSLRANAR